MWARKIDRKREKAEHVISVTVEKWVSEGLKVEETLDFAVDLQALSMFRERLKKGGHVGVVAIGGNRDCRVDLTHVSNVRLESYGRLI